VTAGLKKDLDQQCLNCVIGEENLFRSRKQSLAAFSSSQGENPRQRAVDGERLANHDLPA
jgi:hypothetical protein